MLETLNNFLVERFGQLGPLYAIGFLGLLLIIATLPTFLKREKDPLDKLKQDNRSPSANKKEEDIQLLRQRSKVEKLDKFATFLEPQTEEEMSAAKLKLMQAGYRSKTAVRAFHFAQLALGIGFLLAGILYAVVSSATGDVSTQKMIMSVLLPAGAGYYLPKYWVTRRVQGRQEEIINGFPDSLDMMLVCVEAGQSLDQAIVRVAKEIRAGYPALSEEYEIVAHEMKAGKDKVQVLKDMGERCGVSDISSFVTVLVQSTSFGTSIADALRVYGDEMRDKRVMRAEEKANVLPTKLTLGTMMFTVPPLLIILLGPSVYDIVILLDASNF